MEAKELAEKYGIDLKELEDEQIKLAKQLEIKDVAAFSGFEKIGAIENIIIKYKIISAVIVCDKEYEIIEQEYFLDKLRFPYIHGFKSYRELPPMTAAFNKIKEKPDIMLIKGDGINHSRLGIASHFSIAVGGLPTIGVTDKLFEGNKIVKEEVVVGKDKVGKVLKTKEGAKPLLVYPGNRISIESAYEFVSNMVVPPHKLPEPLALAHKYAKDIKKEMKLN